MFFGGTSGGQTGPAPLRAGLRRGRGSAIRARDDAERVAVRLCDGADLGTAAGETNPGGSAVAVSGGRGGAGSLGAERVSAAASAGGERRVHAGTGTDPGRAPGAAGAGSGGFDADRGVERARAGRFAAALAKGTGTVPAAGPAVAAAMRES